MELTREGAAQFADLTQHRRERARLGQPGTGLLAIALDKDV